MNQLSRSQPIYIANPRFIKGAVDPLGGIARFVALDGDPLDVSGLDLSTPARRPRRGPTEGMPAGEGGGGGVSCRTWEEVRALYAGGHQHDPSKSGRCLFVAEHGEGAREKLDELAQKLREHGCTDESEIDDIPNDVDRLLGKGFGLRWVAEKSETLMSKLSAGVNMTRDKVTYYPRDMAYTLARRSLMHPGVTKKSIAHLMGYEGVEANVDAYLAERADAVVRWKTLTGAEQITGLDQVRMEPGITFLRAPLGVGKTEGVAKQWIGAVDHPRYIASRIKLSQDAAKRLDLNHYENIRKKHDDAANRRLAVCINSISHPNLLAYSDIEAGARAWPELVVIDELKSVLDSMSEPAIHKRHREVFEELAQLIRHADYVLVLDAGLTDEDVEDLTVFAEHAGAGEASHLYQMPDELGPMAGRVWEFTEPAVVAWGFNTADAGVLGADSKKLVESFPDKVKKINGDRRDPRFFENPTEFARRHTHIAVSPAADTGVSIVGTKHQVFLMMMGVLAPEEVLQMSARVRSARVVNISARFQMYGMNQKALRRFQAALTAASGKEKNWIDRWVFARQLEQALRRQYGYGVLPAYVEAIGDTCRGITHGRVSPEMIKEGDKNWCQAVVDADEYEYAAEIPHDDKFAEHKHYYRDVLDYWPPNPPAVRLARKWRNMAPVAAVAFGSPGFEENKDAGVCQFRGVRARGLAVRDVLAYLTETGGRLDYKFARGRWTLLVAAHPIAGGVDEGGPVKNFQKVLGWAGLKFQRVQQGQAYRQLDLDTLEDAGRFAAHVDPGVSLEMAARGIYELLERQLTHHYRPAMSALIGAEPVVWVRGEPLPGPPNWAAPGAQPVRRRRAAERAAAALQEIGLNTVADGESVALLPGFPWWWGRRL